MRKFLETAHAQSLLLDLEIRSVLDTLPVRHKYQSKLDVLRKNWCSGETLVAHLLGEELGGLSRFTYSEPHMPYENSTN